MFSDPKLQNYWDLERFYNYTLNSINQFEHAWQY